MAEGNVDTITKSGIWNISIPRATFTVEQSEYLLIGNRFCVCSAIINITDSQTGNAYIDESCLPIFTGYNTGDISLVTGFWVTENDNTPCILCSATGNPNSWFSKNGTLIPLTAYIGKKIKLKISAFKL